MISPHALAAPAKADHTSACSPTRNPGPNARPFHTATARILALATLARPSAAHGPAASRCNARSIAFIFAGYQAPAPVGLHFPTAMPHKPAPSPATPPSPLPPVAAPFPDAITIAEPLCAVFRRTLKAEGLKYTPERARILDAVIGMTEPFHAEHLLDTLRADAATSGFRISKATVYRTIKLLADAGILQQVLLGSDQAHYALAYGQAASATIVNTATGQIEQAALPQLAALRDELCRQRGLVADGHRLIIYARPANG